MRCVLGLVTMFVLWTVGTVAAADGNPERGKRAFRTCSACHSLEPGRHLTGPSLAGIWGQKTGMIEGFTRYSDAMKSSEIVWNAETLNTWLRNSRALIPGNRMTFRGIADEGTRRDLVAYLKLTSQSGVASPRSVGRARGARGASASERMANLKAVKPTQQVVAIRYCGDTYRVTTATGETEPFWEFNLRFKTDSSEFGPMIGRPALLRASMQGDRAFVIFTSPKEISSFIEAVC